MADKLVRFLGFFSLGLGVPQLVAPGLVNRLIGVEDDATARRWQRFVGVQELGAATGLLSGAWTTPYLWGRVGGDALHLGLLGAAWRSKREDDARLALAIGNVAAIGVLDVVAAVVTTRGLPATPTGATETGA